MCKICWQNWIESLISRRDCAYWYILNGKQQQTQLAHPFCQLFLDHSASQRNVILLACIRLQPHELSPTGSVSVTFLASPSHLISNFQTVCHHFSLPNPREASSGFPKYAQNHGSQNPPGGIPLPQRITSRCYIIATFFIRRVISSLDHLAHGINGFVQEWLDDEKAIQIVYPSTGISCWLYLIITWRKLKQMSQKDKDGICKLIDVHISPHPRFHFKVSCYLSGVFHIKSNGLCFGSPTFPS